MFSGNKLNFFLENSCTLFRCGRVLQPYSENSMMAP